MLLLDDRVDRARVVRFFDATPSPTATPTRDSDPDRDRDRDREPTSTGRLLLAASPGPRLLLHRRRLPLRRRSRSASTGPPRLLDPFRIANRYGLFAVMTRARYEIEFQGSRDGETWKPIRSATSRRTSTSAPGIYAPYQPRFEWNLWFASLGSWRNYPFVVRAEARLLDGSPSVLSLFARDPFDGKPPRFVRAVISQYHFTDSETQRTTGAWWTRETPVALLPRGHAGDATGRSR